jgi:hypothetical protein
MKKIILIVVTMLILVLAVRGNVGNPSENEIGSRQWTEDGPLELSPERGRFALLMSLVENKSFFFSLPLARLATPDLGYANGHYVSLFAPGVSLITIPGYILGKTVGMSQVGTFLMISIVAMCNVLLIRAIAEKMGASKTTGTIGGLIFMFGTPAFAYGVTLYQHHISTFLILLAFYLLISKNDWLSLATIWLLCAFSIVVDYPNLFLMFPIGLASLSKIVSASVKSKQIEVNVKLWRILTFGAMILPLLIFGWFNKGSYNNPWQLSGTVPGVRQIDDNGKPTAPKGADLEDVEKYVNPDAQKKSAVGFFKSRYLVNGLYIHFLSPDRGMFVYTPIVLLGFVGLLVLYKKRTKYVDVAMAIILMDVLLYSMWGDPWGGWAFGSRYLIPAYSILAVGLAMFLYEYSKYYVVVIGVLLLTIYSTAINTLGAITSNRNPPQVEILELEKVSGRVQRYDYRRNWEMVEDNHSKSLVFQTIGKNYVDAKQYYFGLVMLINLIVASQLIVLRRENNEI